MPTTFSDADGRQPRGGYPPPPPEPDLDRMDEATDQESWEYMQALDEYLADYPDAARDYAEFGRFFPSESEG